jgi:hypothetical protein
MELFKKIVKTEARSKQYPVKIGNFFYGLSEDANKKEIKELESFIEKNNMISTDRRFYPENFKHLFNSDEEIKKMFTSLLLMKDENNKSVYLLEQGNPVRIFTKERQFPKNIKISATVTYSEIVTEETTSDSDQAGDEITLEKLSLEKYGKLTPILAEKLNQPESEIKKTYKSKDSVLTELAKFFK